MSALFHHYDLAADGQKVLAKWVQYIANFLQRIYNESHAGGAIAFPAARLQAMRSLTIDGVIDQETLMACKPADAMLLCLDILRGCVHAIAHIHATAEDAAAGCRVHSQRTGAYRSI